MARNKCVYHRKEHDDFHWKGFFNEKKKLVYICSEGMDPPARPSGILLGTSKTDKRLAHWEDIKSRVTTHEGEFLTGLKGREYQQKYSKQMLGRDLSAPPQFNSADHLRELSKRK